MEPSFMIQRIPYKTVFGRSLRLLRVTPPEWRETDRRAAVVWIHGGGWADGFPERFLRHGEYFSERGVVSFCVEYRLIGTAPQNRFRDSEVSIADCIEDCKSAVRYIRAHAESFGIDPERIVAVGDSAGGHLAACLGTIEEFEGPEEDRTVSSRADAVIVCNGIFELTGKWKTKLDAEPFERIEDEVERWTARQAYAKRLSPLYHIAPGQPPYLLLHGLRDQVVPAEDSERFAEAYRAAGNAVEREWYPESDHAFILFQYHEPEEVVYRALERMERFLADLGFIKK